MGILKSYSLKNAFMEKYLNVRTPNEKYHANKKCQAKI